MSSRSYDWEDAIKASFFGVAAVLCVVVLLFMPAVETAGSQIDVTVPADAPVYIHDEDCFSVTVNGTTYNHIIEYTYDNGTIHMRKDESLTAWLIPAAIAFGFAVAFSLASCAFLMCAVGHGAKHISRKIRRRREHERTCGKCKHLGEPIDADTFVFGCAKRRTTPDPLYNGSYPCSDLEPVGQKTEEKETETKEE